MKIAKYFSISLMGMVLLTGCIESETLQSELDETAVVNYLNAKGLPYTRDNSGYFYHIENAGTGDVLVDSSVVKMDLSAKDLSGKLISDTIVSKPISDVSYSLRSALPKIKVGGEINIYIPAYLNSGIALDLNSKVPYRYANQREADDSLIVDYLRVKGLVATKDSRGFYYSMVEEGSGSNPTINSVVVVKYVGRYMNGTEFDKTSGDLTAAFSLTKVIKGWQYGLPLMKVGGRATFYFPSELGYGKLSQGKIPANSILIFDITLTDVR